jgi:hypothetical protein
MDTSEVDFKLTTEKQKKEDITARPKQSAEDALHTTARALISAIPIVGSSAEKFFTLIVAPPLQKKAYEWMDDLASHLHKLEEKYQGFKIENLVTNELFQATLLHATAVAIRNYQKEKKEALRNAVLNTALRTSSDDDMELLFVAFIDVCTPRHIEILRFFDDPKKWALESNITFPTWSYGSPYYVIEYAFPKLSMELCNAILKDLFDRGLLKTDLDAMTNGAGKVAQRVTPMGKKFLAFISSPV